MFVEVSKEQFESGIATLIRLGGGTMLRGGRCEEYGLPIKNKLKFRKEIKGDTVRFYQFMKPEYA